MLTYKILFWWSVLGAIPWQLIILRPWARDNPHKPITVLACIKALPFGPVVWLSYFITIIIFQLRKVKERGDGHGSDELDK